ncbi:jacalin-like lectin [Spirillospora sp. NPDC048911]|uniref:jacalin-like lectin n=1 Tax=Spirillospora sp. NPDC048911 TaxID=3364527 RepID=UPI00371ABA56
MLRPRRLAEALLALVSTAALSTAVAAPASAAAGGSFTVMTYNIAGLPEGLSSAPTPRAPATTAIGQRLGPYDVVQVQEDFNYHANLYAAGTHPYRTPTSGGAGIGSGLNLLSSHPTGDDDFERVKWQDCNLNSGDCLTPKGFTFMRVRVAEGDLIDFYNLHADAGSDSGDVTARAANLRQLTSFIKAHSNGNAVVVMGDTNARYTRSGDGATLRAFAADNGLTDAWVQLPRKGSVPAEGSPALVCDPANVTDTCETVDKIFYRSGRLITLTASGYANEHAKFLDDSGRMLSDHDPIVTRFSWAQNPDYQFGDQFGGPHGTYFNDVEGVPAGARATRISLRTGARVNQIGITLADGTAFTHGGTGGTASSLSLGSGEYVTSAYLCQGQKDGHTRIFYAKLSTNLGNTLAGGTTTSTCTTRTAPSGWQIAGFHGRSGDELDKVGLIYTQR